MRSGLKCFKIFLWICLTNTLHKILLEKFIFGKVAPLKYTHASKSSTRLFSTYFANT